MAPKLRWQSFGCSGCLQAALFLCSDHTLQTVQGTGIQRVFLFCKLSQPLILHLSQVSMVGDLQPWLVWIPESPKGQTLGPSHFTALSPPLCYGHRTFCSFAVAQHNEHSHPFLLRAMLLPELCMATGWLRPAHGSEQQLFTFSALN